MATAILMPKQGNTVEECLLAKWLKKPGQTVAAGEGLLDIETDKATFTVEAPEAGTLLEVFAAEGELVPVQNVIAIIGKPGEDISALRPGSAGAPTGESVASPAPSVAESPASAPAVANTPVGAPALPGADSAPLSPRARKYVAEHPVAVPAGMQGSGAEGRIIEKDVKALFEAGPRLSPVAAAKLAAGEAVPAQGSGVNNLVLGSDMGKAAAPMPVGAPALPGVPEEGVPLSNIRKIIASRLVESLQTLAQFTLNLSADATAILAVRKRVKDNAAKLGLPDVSINDMVNYAVVQALLKHPEINAEYIGGKVFQRRAVNLGFACDTSKGLMVPVIRNAQTLTLGGLAKATKALATAAQEGKISPDDMAGGSFTVSNLGVFGITSFSPVINAPQVGILGVCGLELKPVRRANGQVEFVDHIGFSLTLDHRVVDGAPGAKFLKTLKETIENFDLVCMVK